MVKDNHISTKNCFRGKKIGFKFTPKRSVVLGRLLVTSRLSLINSKVIVDYIKTK